MPELLSTIALGCGQATDALALLVAAKGFGLFHVYLIFLILGLIYAAFTFFFSSLGGDHDVSAAHDVDVGGVDAGHDFGAGHDVDVGHGADVGHDAGAGHDLGHGGEHGELAAVDGSVTQLGPFSPMIVAMFFTCFGLSGTILTKPIPIGWLSLLPSVVVAVAGAWASMSVFNKLFAITEASSEAEAWRLVGSDAQVITPIPEGGVGEIQYVAKGSTFSAPARADDGRAVSRGVKVTITDSSRTIFTVKKSIEERFRDLERGT
jgi:hypothetical protein